MDYTWRYEGPVLQWDRVIADKWTAETIAPSEKKARSNLTYRYKKENGFEPRAKITLPGKVVKA